MEGIIQYRLLGSHPAASGRYLTLGFPGEVITVQKVLHELTTEHQINDKRYRLDVARMAPTLTDSASVGASMDPNDYGRGGGVRNSSTAALTETALRVSDVLHTYDRITITISARQLNDKTASPARRAQEAQSRRLREVERQIASPDLLFAGHPLGVSHANQHMGSASIMRHASLAHHNQILSSSSSCLPLAQGAGGKSTSQSSPSSTGLPPSYAASSASVPQRRDEVLVDEDRDTYELQRAAVLAEQSYPVCPGGRLQHVRPQQTQSGVSSSYSDAPSVNGNKTQYSRAIADAELCALCRLPPYRPTRQLCCGAVVCSSCVEAARMMWSSSTTLRAECPVCGGARAPLHTLSSDVDAHSVRRGVSSAATADRADADATAALLRRRQRLAQEECERPGPACTETKTETMRPMQDLKRTPTCRTTESADTTADAESGGGCCAAHAESAARVVSVALSRCERVLHEGMDQILAMLDAPDPLGEQDHGRRVPSAALCALDSIR